MAKSMPKWPKEISILGHTYTVEALAEVLNDDGEEVEGICDDKKKEIKVKSKDNKAVMWSSLIHEIGHAWLRESGLEGNMSDDMEELVVISLEKHFAPLLLGLVGKGHVSSMSPAKPASKRGVK